MRIRKVVWMLVFQITYLSFIGSPIHSLCCHLSSLYIYVNDKIMGKRPADEQNYTETPFIFKIFKVNLKKKMYSDIKLRCELHHLENIFRKFFYCILPCASNMTFFTIFWEKISIKVTVTNIVR